MKKIIEFLKSLFKKEQVSTPATYAEVKKEAKEQAEKIVAALDEVKAKETVRKKNVATSPAALGGGMKPLEEAPVAPKKKKRYYKPKPKA